MMQQEKAVQIDSLLKRTKVRFGASRSFGLAQGRLHQVAAATAPQTRDLLTPSPGKGLCRVQ
jgi:hypothetical protein